MKIDQYAVLRCVLAAAALYLASMQVARAQASGEEAIKPVMQQAIPELAGKNVDIATVTFAPGQASAPHMHPGSIFAYVTVGHVVSQLEGSPARTYGPGEAWYEPPGAHHLVSRNASDTEPAQIVVFALAGPHDPIKTPIPR